MPNGANASSTINSRPVLRTEVAIVSMEQALKADGEDLPVGSGTLARDVLEIPGTVVKGEAAAPVSIDPPLPGA